VPPLQGSQVLLARSAMMFLRWVIVPEVRVDDIYGDAGSRH
jgi:hypothetical protein